MAKRFVDTDLFRKPLLRSLGSTYKLFWVYLLCECDHAGVWDVELDVASMRLGVKLDGAKCIAALGSSIVQIDGGRKWWLPEFIAFQYGTMNPLNRVHSSALATLAKYGIDPSQIQKEGATKDLPSPSGGAKDKDKDKDNTEGKEHAHELKFPAWSTDVFNSKWKLWRAYKAERGEKYKPIGEQSALTKLGKDYPDETSACAAIDHSMGQNYQGIYPAKAGSFPAVSIKPAAPDGWNTPTGK